MHRIVTASLILLIPCLGWAFSNNPPNGRTGAPGEGNCTGCHTSFPVNSGNGVLSIDAPATFEAGQTYEITVTLNQTDKTRWGFQLTPLDQGTIELIDDIRTRVETESGKQYVEHRSSGTNAGQSGPTSWSFNWIAPQDPPEQVTFYAAGNAANNNNSSSGDHIYLTSVTLSLQPMSVENGPSLAGVADILINYPNPFRASTTIQFQVAKPGVVNLTVYNTAGQMVEPVISNMYYPNGQFEKTWAGVDANGELLPTGTYFYKLVAPDIVETKKLTIVR